MAFKKGQQGLGRPKGLINRNTAYFIGRMEELNAFGLKCDPIQILMEIACGKQLNADGTTSDIKPAPEAKDRVKAATELCSYVYPKRKAMEITGKEGQPIMFAVLADENDAPPEFQEQSDGSFVLPPASDESAELLVESSADEDDD